MTCYKEYGSPNIVSGYLISLAVIAMDINYSGACHIVIEDWNLEDGHILFCLKQNDVTNYETLFLIALLLLSFRERVSVLALREGYIKI